MWKEITCSLRTCRQNILFPLSTFPFPPYIYCGIDEPAKAGHDEGQPEEEFETGGKLIKEYADGRRNGHGKVV